jgi:glutathione S-transferase
MYLRVIGPLDRQRPKDEVMRDVRRSTDDPAHLDWVSRVYDGTVVDENEAAHLASQLYHRIDHIEGALAGQFLVGDELSIADISVYPRVAMYPMVGLQLDPAKYPRTVRWMSEMAGRSSFKRSERVRPD